LNCNFQELICSNQGFNCINIEVSWEIRKQIKKYWKKIKKKCINKKSIPECPWNCRRLVEEDQIYRIKKFSNVFSTDERPIGKENSIWEKNKNWMFKDSIRIFQGLFEFIEDLIAGKLIF
jgi:hypothetical protein